MNNMQIIEWKVENLKNYERHVRKFGRAAVTKMADALVEYGFRVPLLVTGDGTLVDGHLRLAGAQKIKMAAVPVVIVDGMGAAQLRRFRLSINSSAYWAGFDEELLALELAELSNLGEDLTLTGFAVTELDRLLAQAFPKRDKDLDMIPELPENFIVHSEESWVLGEHRLYCGDSTLPESYEVLLGQAKVDAIWTDPPYNVGYEGKAGKIMNDSMSQEKFGSFLLAVFGNLYGRIKDGGPFYVAFAHTETAAFHGGLERSGFKVASCLIWVKNNIVLGRSDYQWRHEPILYGWKPTAPHCWYGGRKRHSVMESDVLTVTADGDRLNVALGDTILSLSGSNLKVESFCGNVLYVDKPLKSNLHPTTKPVELIESCLKNSSRPGDLVLDSFGGSGSTLIACERLGRKARLIELDPRFASVIVRRWEDFTGRKAQRLEACHG